MDRLAADLRVQLPVPTPGVFKVHVQGDQQRLPVLQQVRRTAIGQLLGDSGLGILERMKAADQGSHLQGERAAAGSEERTGVVGSTLKDPATTILVGDVVSPGGVVVVVQVIHVGRDAELVEIGPAAVGGNPLQVAERYIDIEMATRLADPRATAAQGFFREHAMASISVTQARGSG
jgi:hypothetical protein